MQYELHDRVKMRKTHPCGSDEWEIIRSAPILRSNALVAAVS